MDHPQSRAAAESHCPVTVLKCDPVCPTSSLESQSSVACSLCPREPEIKTRLSVLRIQTGVPWAGHRDLLPYHSFFPSTNEKTKYFSAKKKKKKETLFNYTSCGSTIVFDKYIRTTCLCTSLGLKLDPNACVNLCVCMWNTKITYKANKIQFHLTIRNRERTPDCNPEQMPFLQS